MSINNKHLFEKLQNGDDNTFEIIYKKFAPRLFYFVYEYVPQKDIAENIIQETFMTLWNKKNDLVVGTNISAYLYTIAKNNCLYKLRDQRYQQQLFDTTDIDEMELKANYKALDSLETSNLTMMEISEIVERTMEKLPAQCRVVFNLSRFEEKKNKEIAAELNISEKAVEGHISKALKVFRVALKDYMPIVAFLFA